jgi:hypothetical protein
MLKKFPTYMCFYIFKIPCHGQHIITDFDFAVTGK